MGQTAEELRAQLADQRDDLSRDFEAVGDRVSPGRMMERRQQAVRRSVHDLRDRVMGAADGPTTRASDMASGASTKVVDSMSGGVDRAMGSTQGNPVAVGMVAFGAGLVLATLFPASRPEQRLADKAQPALEDAATRAAPVVEQMVTDVKEQVEPAVRTAASEVQGRAMQAADDIKSEAQSSASGGTT